MHSHARFQIPLGLSSPEAEYYGICGCAAELFNIHCILDELENPHEVLLESDASSAIAIASRIGVGRVRHLETRFLWLQGYIKQGLLKIAKVKREENETDIGTKALAAVQLEKC